MLVHHCNGSRAEVINYEHLFTEVCDSENQLRIFHRGRIEANILRYDVFFIFLKYKFKNSTHPNFD